MDDALAIKIFISALGTLIEPDTGIVITINADDAPESFIVAKVDNKLSVCEAEPHMSHGDTVVFADASSGSIH